jgi:hypothetical protein
MQTPSSVTPLAIWVPSLLPLGFNAIGWYQWHHEPHDRTWKYRTVAAGLVANLFATLTFCWLIAMEARFPVSLPGVVDTLKISGLVLCLFSFLSAILVPSRARIALLAGSIIAGLLWSIVGVAFL